MVKRQSKYLRYHVIPIHKFKFIKFVPIDAFHASYINMYLKIVFHSISDLCPFILMEKVLKLQLISVYFKYKITHLLPVYFKYKTQVPPLIQFF